MIPDIYTSIDQSAFSLSDLTSVVIPESITSIGALVFWGNDLTSVCIGDNITSIGEIFMGVVGIGDLHSLTPLSSLSASQQMYLFQSLFFLRES